MPTNNHGFLSPRITYFIHLNNNSALEMVAHLAHEYTAPLKKNMVLDIPDAL